jgi:hypothetical protein
MFESGINGSKRDDREIRCVHVFSRVISHVVLVGEKLYAVPAQVRTRHTCYDVRLHIDLCDASLKEFQTNFFKEPHLISKIIVWGKMSMA